MSESKFETVSLLVDNYQQNNESLNAVVEDEQLSDTWDRYHLIGDVIRGEAVNVLPSDFSANVANAIAEEATVLAPQHNTTNENVKAKVIKLFKPLGQFAIAASAAGLMILGVQQHNVAQNEPNAVPAQVIQTTPFGGVADPVSLNFQQPDINAQRQAYIEQQRRFQALLSDHQRQLKLKALAEHKAQQEGKKTPK